MFTKLSKNTRSILGVLALLLCFQSGLFAQKKNKPSKKDTLVTLSTPFGDMKILLYEKTPLHRSNFLKLVKEDFYDGLLFHRVIEDFMVQGGDPESKNAKPGQSLGSGGLKYTIPAEFDTSLFHKKGALAAARTNNPQKASSSCQFYIVQGKKMKDLDLSQVENRFDFKYSEAQKEVYRQMGGTPFLDQNYTVYGEVIQGIEVIDKIAAVKTARGNRPEKDVSMNMSYEVLKKKKIMKEYGYVYPGMEVKKKKKKKK